MPLEISLDVKQFDKWCKLLENTDKKLTNQYIRIVLRESTKQAVQSLKQDTKATFKKHKGWTAKSVRTMLKVNKQTKVPTLYYGWSDKNIPTVRVQRVKKRTKSKGKLIDRVGQRTIPRPAQYIGIWQDLGTKYLEPKYLFRTNFAKNKDGIVRNINKAIDALIKHELEKK